VRRQQCRHENPPQSKFCSECGARLVVKCAGCGAELSAAAKFCSQCGRPAAEQSRFESLKTYTPKHLGEKILTSRASLEGERKQVTVLFADIKGSMELLAERDPEEARKILDPVLERMMEAVHRYEGTVNQVMGDGIMALFGAPVAHEDHAVRACYAALRMQEAVENFAQELQRSEGIPMQIRVGLNSGEVVVRSIGSDLHMDYTAVGQTTHLAARMEQIAMPGSVLVSAGTLKLAEGYIEVKPLGPVNLKGLAEPVEVFEVTGASAVRRRLDAAKVRGLTPFIGRTTELDQLRKAFDHAGESHGQVVAVVGEPGVGKSRLFFEFTRSHRTKSWLFLESSSVSYGKATAFLPVIDLLKSYFQIQARDDARKIREKVTGKLVALDRALEPALPAILSLLDVTVEDPRWRDLDAPQRRQRTVEAIKHLLLRESQVQPLCVVFEDLHWIDSETQVVLDSLIENLPAARILLLANYRPEYRHGWSAKTYYTQLRVDALPSESAEELLGSLLGNGASLRALKELLIKHTEGNPFFLEESVRTLVETQTLAGERGAYRLDKPVEAIQVPATVQAVVAARIDRLSPDEKHVLQFASVIGETVPQALLQAVVDTTGDVFHSALGRLQAIEFLYQTGLFPDIEYTFKHGLSYQVAYESLLQERRRALHARIVDALETLHSGSLAEQMERLAHHAVRGAVWDKALRFLNQAAGKALARSATHQALALLDQALEVAAKLPESRETLSELLDVQLKRGPTLIMLKSGADPEVERCYASAQGLCEKLGDENRRFPAVWGRWAAAFFSGRCRAAEELAGHLLTIGRASGDSMRHLEGHHTLWSTQMLTGGLTEACTHAERGIGLYDPHVHHSAGLLYGGHDPGVCAHFVSAWVLWDLGRADQALRRIEEAQRLARELSHWNTIAAATTFAAFLHYLRGENESALEKSRAIEQLARSHGLGQWAVAQVLEGHLQVLGGRHADGIEKATRAIPMLRGWRYAVALPILAQAYADAGETSKGLTLLTEGIAAAERDGLGFHFSEFYRLRGELLAKESGRAGPEAMANVHRAIEIAQRQQAKSLELRAAMSLARLLASQGQRDEARTVLAKNYAWFTEGLDTRDLKDARAALDNLK
jgi:class 3 adenylate cyclase/predicted ATPase